MKVLVLNSGSSTIKHKRSDRNTDYRLLTNSTAERIGLDKGRVRYQVCDQQRTEIVAALPDHDIALQTIFEILKNDRSEVPKSKSRYRCY
jgi:acetate kinase